MTLHYWQFFLAIEADLADTARYVEFADDNMATYSIEYVRILLSAGSEVDVVAKLLCKRIDSNRQVEKIGQYRSVIAGECPRLHSTEVLIPRYKLTAQPWKAWRDQETPAWWRAYNQVKHSRHERFREASLRNALDAVAGLFCLVLYLYRQEGRAERLEPDPRILTLEHSPGSIMLEQGYKVPDDLA